jgi:hypothetical protein
MVLMRRFLRLRARYGEREQERLANRKYLNVF